MKIKKRMLHTFEFDYMDVIKFSKYEKYRRLDIYLICIGVDEKENTALYMAFLRNGSVEFFRGDASISATKEQYDGEKVITTFVFSLHLQRLSPEESMKLILEPSLELMRNTITNTMDAILNGKRRPKLIIKN